ncbi:MAG: PD40 domain-containing protein [Planctomycetes bacterium]|nr:PD40 domain-containing protein [Planctomycetota bacterium]
MTISRATRLTMNGIAVSACAVFPATAQTTTRVSVSTTGVESDGYSYLPRLSADGRFVAFVSAATNLVPGDVNGVADIFVHDRLSRITERVSVDSNGVEADNYSDFPAISGDGRFVAFVSDASNLVPGDGNGSADIFVHDRVSRATTRVSVDSSGQEGDGESGVKYGPCLSSDGRFVVFTSAATNLVSDDTNGTVDVFVHDRQTGVTTRVSVGTGGVEGDAASFAYTISADGRYVPFHSISVNWLPGGGNGAYQQLLHDRATGVTDLVSVAPDGQLANLNSLRGTVSDDGRYVAFESYASNLVARDLNVDDDVFVRDRQAGMTTRISVSSLGVEGNSVSAAARISSDGRYVLFGSGADDLVVGDRNGAIDSFLHDRQTGSTERVSVGAAGQEADGQSGFLGYSLSADARMIAFASDATNLVPNDRNAVADVFVRDTNAPVHLSSVLPANGSESGGDVITLFGYGFDDGTGLLVTCGASRADVLSATPTRATVRTPPGIGAVDVSVSNPLGASQLRSAFAYVDPALAARFGNVNAGVGNREAVLFVNGSAGDAGRHRYVSASSPFTLDVQSPSSRPSAGFVLYAWPGHPDRTTLTTLPRFLGRMVEPPPFAHSPIPVRVLFNNIGHVAVLGLPVLPSSAAPFEFTVPRGVRRATTVALQGIIEDDGSAIPEGWSLTNAVVVEVVE